MHKTFISALVLLIFSSNINCSTSGSNRISTHYYHQDAPLLDKSPVMCGILGSHMDLDRVTAVQDLLGSECGTCLKVSGNDKVVYVMAVDKGGQGLDINMNSFKELFGEESGRFEASWEATDSGNCAGIIKGGSYELPGFRSSPSPSKGEKHEEVKPSETQKPSESVRTQATESKTAQSTNSSSQNTDSSDQSITDIPTSSTDSTQTTSTSSTNSNLETKPTQIQGEFSCNDFEIKCNGKTKYTQCVFGILFHFNCPNGMKCIENESSSPCQ
ncbi:hypothetical protein K502DRAFT_342610 [Neoconidiobolus thromboides FSU 785]|nr:hypothetical protein K502DRAFT_342610 [Neoconidiobolus thromboides FSU 785]